MKKFLLPALFAALALYSACTPKSGSKITETPAPSVMNDLSDTLNKPLMSDDEAPAEYTFMNDAEVSPDAPAIPDTLPAYNPSNTFVHDLIHTKIDISFDWEKKRANGKATLTLRPWFYPSEQLTLDAKNFDIHSVTFEGKSEQLIYQYNNEQITINLGRTFQRTEEYKIVITYTAKPDERQSGGSEAITSDKGLFFINADGADPAKPKQIWTQGETESNSCWFPTIDKPNERCTQEMYITVADSFKTLSNGILVSSKKNKDGTRTDYWKMDKPHAPYLFMMAIGQYAVVQDKWRGIDVAYYVEPKYEQSARDIYPYTTDMLSFFSDKLGYQYPWSKFSQVIVRDYVSGAMENTTAVIFGEFMQKNKRELLDDHLTNEKIVAHEMFHHWFGDLVTTESWANLTLNEGFANYSEYLWMEHKHGADAADEHLMNEQQGYIFSAADGGHPLIHFGYDNRESMFDAHSYNKGGCVLHMLRGFVGDDAFFASLNRYLKKNEYSDVEAHELRLAFEDVTGQDLNWFFNQWFFSAGHPNLDISYQWDEASGKISVDIAQTQQGDKVPAVFELPLAVDIYDASGKARRENIRVTKRNQHFEFAAAGKPAFVNVDADKRLLCVKADVHSPEEWAFLYNNGPKFRDRYEALEQLQGNDAPFAKAAFVKALQDKFYGIRLFALQQVDAEDPAVRNIAAQLAANDPEPAVRAAAMQILGKSGDKQYVSILQKGLDPSQPYSVVGSALSALTEIDPDAAIEASKSLQNDESDAIVTTLTELYARKPDRANLAYFEKKMANVDYMNAFAFFDHYQRFLFGLGDELLTDQGVDKIKAVSLNSQTSPWRRFGATKAIADLRNALREKGNTAKADGLNKLLEEIKEKETDPTLKLYYGMF